MELVCRLACTQPRYEVRLNRLLPSKRGIQQLDTVGDAFHFRSDDCRLILMSKRVTRSLKFARVILVNGVDRRVLMLVADLLSTLLAGRTAK